MSQPPGHLAGRYGDARASGPARRLTVAVAAGAAVLFVAWVLWAGLGAASRDASASVIAYDVRSSSSVDATVRVQRKSATRLGCSVQALDADGEVVGVTDVILDPARSGVPEREVTVRTRARSATVTIGRCAPLGPGND